MKKELVELIKDAEAEAAARVEKARAEALSATDAVRLESSTRVSKAYEDARLDMYSRISAASAQADADAAEQTRRGLESVKDSCEAAEGRLDRAIAAVVERIGG